MCCGAEGRHFCLSPAWHAGQASCEGILLKGWILLACSHNAGAHQQASLPWALRTDGLDPARLLWGGLRESGEPEDTSHGCQERGRILQQPPPPLAPAIRHWLRMFSVLARNPAENKRGCACQVAPLELSLLLCI